MAIIKQGKLYTGHVGDSGLVMGENDVYSTTQFPVQAICVTKVKTLLQKLDTVKTSVSLINELINGMNVEIY